MVKEGDFSFALRTVKAMQMEEVSLKPRLFTPIQNKLHFCQLLQVFFKKIKYQAGYKAFLRMTDIMKSMGNCLCNSFSINGHFAYILCVLIIYHPYMMQATWNIIVNWWYYPDISTCISAFFFRCFFLENKWKPLLTNI